MRSTRRYRRHLWPVDVQVSHADELTEFVVELQLYAEEVRRRSPLIQSYLLSEGLAGAAREVAVAASAWAGVAVAASEDQTSATHKGGR